MRNNILILATCMIAFTGCSENSRAKAFGGTMNFEVPSDQAFVNVTWKDESLWVLTKDRAVTDTDYSTYHFIEDSSGGWFEGDVIIKQLKPGQTGAEP